MVKVIPDAYLNCPPGSPISLHKRQVDPLNTLAEAFGFGHRHPKVDRLIR
jgi:hypothetical protein